MTSKNDTELQISRCLRMIEEQLQWGSSDNWTNYDFSKLSDEVHNRTHVRLSVTTLKRVWGRLKYENAPTITTLNALSQFAGFQDWRQFCKQDNGVEPEIMETVLAESPKSPERKQRRYWPLLIIPAVVVVALVILQ